MITFEKNTCATCATMRDACGHCTIRGAMNTPDSIIVAKNYWTPETWFVEIETLREQITKAKSILLRTGADVHPQTVFYSFMLKRELDKEMK